MTTLAYPFRPVMRQTLPGTHPHRMYTREFVDFDAVPSYEDGGPATVVVGGWGVSYASFCRVFSTPDATDPRDGQVELCISRYNPDGRGTIHHELSGGLYATKRDAARAAYEAGLLAFMVYDHSPYPHVKFNGEDMDRVRRESAGVSA